MKSMLFETPWWLLVLFGGTGIYLLVSGNKCLHRPTRNAGFALIALAAGLTLVSWFVETDQEQVEKRSRQFVQAVEKEDWKTFQSLMQPDATLSVTTLPPLYHGAGADHRGSQGGSEAMRPSVDRRALGGSREERPAVYVERESILASGPNGRQAPPLHLAFRMGSRPRRLDDLRNPRTGDRRRHAGRRHGTSLPEGPVQPPSPFSRRARRAARKRCVTKKSSV